MVSVALEKLRFVYANGHVAVEGADLDIESGEFIVLVGPSGCGKSTTLRMIAGLEGITSGSLWIDGKCMNDVAAKDRNIAMVFQNYALYPHMNVFDNMAFALRNRGHKAQEIKQRVYHAAEILGLTDKLNAKPRQLSGGQSQRVALGRAIVRRADVFLFDEPLSNLDAQMRVQMRSEIARLHRSMRRTMIYVTHDQLEAMTLGDRIVVMRDGRIQQVGTPLDVYKRPANRFVAGFIGSPAMNFLDGRIEDGMFRTDGITLSHDRFTPFTGRDVSIALRPGDVSLVESGGIAAIVDSFETTGSEAFAYVHLREAPHNPFVIKAEPDMPLRPEREVMLHLDLHKAHIFDFKSGEAISYGCGN